MAGGNLSLLLLVGGLVAALGALYANPVPFLNTFAGRKADFTIQTNWKGNGPLRNDKCWKNPVGQACEDVRIHYPSGVAFLACGYPETRNVWYPSVNRVDAVNAPTYHEYFLKYDINTNTTIPLKIDGLSASDDLILHGIDLVVPKDDDSKVYLFAVNHGRKGESILRFSHKLGSDVLKFEREFMHPYIKTPNSVASTGLNSFFITNDHYFYPGGPAGKLLRTLEDKHGPWQWATEVVHCSSASDSAPIECKSVSPRNAQPSANGAMLVDDGKTLLINDVIDATTTVYDVDPESKELTVKKVVKLGAGADNLSEIPGTGDLAVCVFPDIISIMGKLHGDNPLNPQVIGEAAVVRLVKAKNYEPELFFWDDGNLITLLTGASVDPVRGKLIAGGVVERHFIVCDI